MTNQEMHIPRPQHECLCQLSVLRLQLLYCVSVIPHVLVYSTYSTCNIYYKYINTSQKFRNAERQKCSIQKMQPEMQYTNSGNEEIKPYAVLICLGYLVKD